MVQRLSLTLIIAFLSVVLPAQTYWIEAECARAGIAWQQDRDTLAAEDSLMLGLEPAFITSPTNYPNDWLRIGLEVDTAGNYALFARAQVLDPATNSVWFRVNGGTWMEWENMGIDSDTLSLVPPPTSLPVIPTAQGFGITTPAGRGGTIYKVTNLNDSGPGSFRACAEASGSRVCVFEVGGFIDLQSDIEISSPFLTVAGQTAPSPGIVVGEGFGILVETHDVLIQHISILPGDLAGGGVPNQGDAMQLVSTDSSNRIDNVVLDHVSMAWSMDENLDLWGYLGDISVLNCIIAQNLNLPYDSLNSSSYGNLIGSYDQQNRIFLSGNYYAGNRDRQPLSRIKNLVMTNNLMYDRVLRFVYLSNRLAYGTGGFPTHNTILGNAFVEGPSFAYTLPHEKPITFDLTGQFGSSELYMADNWWSFQNYPSQWQYVKDAQSSIEAFTPPVSLPGLQYETNPSQVVANVLQRAGSRPADRNSLDQSLINGFVQGDSLVRECVTGCSHATGGWPTLNYQYRPLILPSTPHADTDNDGYTDLEEWLHAFSQAVEYGPGDYRWEQASLTGNSGAPILISLDTGMNVIDFAVREYGVKLDKFCITRDSLLVPTGQGQTSIPCDSLPEVLPEIVLPVELLSFTAEPDQDNFWAQVNWTTTAESSHHFFTLERSPDSFSYLPIAEIAPQSEGPSLRQYAYLDQHPNAKELYYRLIQTDLNGQQHYSAPVKVSFSAWAGALQIRVYPVPLNQSKGEVLQADLWADGSSPLQLKLYNSLGQICWEKQITPVAGWQKVMIRTPQLKPGFHSLRLVPIKGGDIPYLTKSIWVY